AILDDSLNTLSNVLLIVDLNRQSLDRVVPGIKAARLKSLFSSCDWQVLEAKFGKRLEDIFARPNGRLLQDRIDEMSNAEYQGLLRKSGAEIRPLLTRGNPKFEALIADISDDELPSVLGDLGGHDFDVLLARLAESDQDKTRPTVLFAYTVKGWGLPMAGHPLNHSMLLEPKQIEQLCREMGMEKDEWADFPSESEAGVHCRARASLLFPERTLETAVASRPQTADPTIPQGKTSTQQSFGRILLALSRDEALAKHLVTISPDVSVSTNLSGWINKMGVFSLAGHEAGSAVTWHESDKGQHIELGISEMNLFMALSMFGITKELLGHTTVPIGTVYDPFVCRGLDAFIYGLYSGSKFIVAGTPSGVTLSPEGGAHQSTVTSSLGMELPNLNYYEPCFATELAWLMVDAISECFDRADGRASYFRLSTKVIDQRPFTAAQERLGEARLKKQVLAGGYRLQDWRSQEGVEKSYLVQLVTTGAMIPEVLQAASLLEEEGIPANVINLTSPRRLFEAWQNGQNDSPFDWLFPQNEHHAPLIIVNDGASHAHAWLGSVFGAPVETLGVDKFGQSGSRDLLYQSMGIDADSIVNAALRALNKQGLV
ncbi:MAG: transketolase C-terminal domain-containing protein, partial [Chloroflexota bacterium]